MTTQIQKIHIKDITVIEGNHRKVNPKKISVLERSMKEIGQKTPISVREGKVGTVLVAGNQRLKAAMSLGWDTIECIVIDGIMDANLWKVAENLHRANLSALERSEQVAEWRRLKKEKRKAGQTALPGGRQPSDRGVSRAAKELAVSREEVRRSDIIAGIAPKAKKAAEAAGLGDNQGALLKIAKESTPEEQLDKVRKLTKRKPTRSSSLSPEQEEQFRKLRRAFELLPNFRRKWNAAAAAVREKFIRTVLRPAGDKTESGEGLDE